MLDRVDLEPLFFAPFVSSVMRVEDHWIDGGLGDAVLEALAVGGAELSGRVIKLAVTEMPGSGTAEELRDWAGISSAKITRAVRSAIGRI